MTVAAEVVVVVVINQPPLKYCAGAAAAAAVLPAPGHDVGGRGTAGAVGTGGCQCGWRAAAADGGEGGEEPAAAQ
jgi:hypothetical protein